MHKELVEKNYVVGWGKEWKKEKMEKGKQKLNIKKALPEHLIM